MEREGETPPFVVYIRGSGCGDYLWYRMLFENNRIRDGDGKRERIKLECVAQLLGSKSGRGGGWAVIGEEDIYWVEGFRDYREEDRFYACLDVFKHNCRNPNLNHWDEVSPKKIPRVSPFVTAVDGGKKLCVVSGHELFLPKQKDDDRSAEDSWNSYSWSKAGELYDPQTNSWTYLDAPMEPFRDYNPLTAALAVDKDEILFHDEAYGCVLFYDLGTEVYFSDLDFFGRHPPEGLKACEDLHIGFQNSSPVLFKDTFYWLTFDLHLFAYDIELETWLQSESLADILGPRQPPTYPNLASPPRSILLGLPNGDLLVIIQEVDGSDGACHLTLASLALSRDRNRSLKVSLRFSQPFSIDDPSFVIVDGKAISMTSSSDGFIRQLERIVVNHDGEDDDVGLKNTAMET